MTKKAVLAETPNRIVAPWLVIAVGVAIAVLICGLTAFGLWQSRLDALALGKQEAITAATLIDHDISSTFEVFDLSLSAVTEELAHDDTRTFSPELQRRVMFDKAAQASYLGSTKVLDEKGDIVIESQARRGATPNYADRDYFAVHRAQPDVGLYVSYPFRARLGNDQPAIALSRRINNHDGSFGGVVFVPVYLSYFSHLFAGLSLGSHAALGLSRPDGIMITRQPYSAKDIGRSFADTPLGRLWASQDSGEHVAVSAVDGTTRLFVFRKIKNLPLIITVGIAQEDIYAGWWHRAIWIGATALLSALLAIIGAVLLAVQLRKRALVEHALAQLARQDPLTGLDNLRTFETRLEQHLSQARAQRQPFSLLFVDIDRFKAYNDIYGYAQGDEVLRTLARCLRQDLLRPVDGASRYGGEEFLLMLPNAATDRAFQMAYNICEHIKTLNIENRGSEFGRVTVSIGISTWSPEQPSDLRTLVKIADRALYEAKSLGRNQVRTQSHSAREAMSETSEFGRSLNY
jgi:diguanylate cyclase (GGDEF)-like protein